jgi:hypothetical protein
VAQDGTQGGGAARQWLDRQRVAEDQQIGGLPAHLRERLATTAQSIAATFELAARVRERMAARSDPEGDYYRSRAAWNRAVARFERRQADAIRSGRLLATPWRRVPDRAHRRQLPTGRTE